MTKRVPLSILVLATLLLAPLSFAGEFLTSRSYPGVNGVYSVAAADFNGDGHVDLAMGSISGVSLSLGNADGSFQLPVTVSTGGLGENGQVAAADINGDGHVDIVISNYGTSRLTVLLGNGDGTFGTPVVTSTSKQPGAILIADLNRDGRPDVVSADFGHYLGVHLGNGDGTFQPSLETSENNLTTIALGDFNKDGIPDVLTSNEYSSVYLSLGNGDGTFQPRVVVEHNDGAEGMVVADLNGDGNLDFAASDFPSGIVYVVLGNGDGTFQPPLATAFGADPQLLAADVNGDGKLDLIAPGQVTVSVALGHGDGTFGAAAAFGTEGTNPRIAVADVNGDGRVDLFGATYSGAIVVLIGLGDGTYIAQRGYIGPGIQGPAVIADFNGDGNPDVATSYIATAQTGQILLGNGDGTLSLGQELDTAYGVYQTATGDLNNDGKLDLAMVLFDGVSTLLGNGDGTFQAHREFGTAQDGTAIALGDFNRDGNLDVAISDTAAGGVYVFLGNGDGTLQPQIFYATGAYPSKLIAADLDGDGNLDLAVPNANDGTVSLLFGKGDGSFQPAVQINTGKILPNAVAAGDLNHDGTLDLVVTTNCSDLNVCATQASVYLNDGDRKFTHSADYPAGAGEGAFRSITIGDANSDGKLDVVTATATSQTAQNVDVLLGKGDGTFNPAKGYTSGSFSVGLADFNQDGAQDIGVGGFPFTVLLNTAGAKLRVAVTPNPAKQGQPVVFKVAVAASVVAQPVPTGSVTLEDGTHIIATLNLVNGQAQFTSSKATVGTLSITATYGGDSHFLRSASKPVTLIVTK